MAKAEKEFRQEASSVMLCCRDLHSVSLVGMEPVWAQSGWTGKTGRREVGDRVLVGLLAGGAP